MKKILIPFILIVICCFSGQPTSSQVGTVTVDDKFKVAVDVTVDNEDRHKISKAAIESYIKRELRSLKDVRVVANEYPGTWKYEISLQMMPAKRKDGTDTASVIYSYMYHEKVDLDHFKDHWRPFHKKFPAFCYPRGALGIHPDDELDKLCKEIVAEFDTKYLEPVRESRTK